MASIFIAHGSNLSRVLFFRIFQQRILKASLPAFQTATPVSGTRFALLLQGCADSCVGGENPTKTVASLSQGQR
jgi:hypothetical protein